VIVLLLPLAEVGGLLLVLAGGSPRRTFGFGNGLAQCLMSGTLFTCPPSYEMGAAEAEVHNALRRFDEYEPTVPEPGP
jgi:hypothetical protein